MWFEYTLDCAKLAKQNNLYTVYVTNGYLSPEALDIIGPYLDAWRVDIKGFSDALYQNLAKITNWRGILEVAQRAKTKWNMHVEVVTNIIPTMNDDDEQLGGIAGWIYNRTRGTDAVACYPIPSQLSDRRSAGNAFNHAGTCLRTRDVRRD